MALLELPPELLLNILHLLGSCFFRQSLNRMTVCKQWYSYASIALCTNIKLSSVTLKQFLNQTSKSNYLHLVRRNLKEIRIELYPYEDLDVFTKVYLRSGKLNRIQITRETYRHYVERGWNAILDANLTSLAILLRDCKNLKAIHFTASNEDHRVVYFDPYPSHYLLGHTLSRLLAVNKLAVLDLDTCGSSIIGEQDLVPGNHAVCTAVQKLLPTLKRLRLRMRSICSEVLRPVHTDGSILLEELIVNLSLSNQVADKSLCTIEDGHPKFCDYKTAQRHPFSTLKKEIEEQAAVLVTMMPAPKIVKVLWHSYPDFKLQSTDILNGRRKLLTEDIDWAANGETDDNSTPEPLDFLSYYEYLASLPLPDASSDLSS